jgi:hypothetical protein
MNNIPKLFFNTDNEDREAVNEILKAKIPCDLYGPISEERTPLLIYDSKRFYGLDVIRDFIERYKNNQKNLT